MQGRIIHIMATAYAAFILSASVSCTRSATVYDDPCEISLYPLAGKTTRAYAGPMQMTYDRKESFGLWAYFRNTATGRTWTEFYGSNQVSEYISGQKFTYDPDTNGWNADRDGHHWPKEGSLMFAGYSPFQMGDRAVAARFNPADASITIDNFIQGNYTSDRNETIDLMWFNINDEGNLSVNNGVSGTTCPVRFHHATAWLTFRFSTEEKNFFYLKSVVLKNIRNKGKFIGTARTSGQTTVPNAAWTIDNMSYADIELYNVTTTPPALTPEGIQAEGLLVIPQNLGAGQKLVITYNEQTPDGTEQTVEILLKPEEGTHPASWLAGKHYTYNVRMKPKFPILLEPSIDNPWGTGGSTDITIL